MYEKLKLSGNLGGLHLPIQEATFIVFAKWSRGYVYCFCQMIQGLRLFRTLEYIFFKNPIGIATILK